MGLLYNEQKNRVTTAHIEVIGDKIFLEFSKNCGKFGTDEIVDGYNLTPARLLQILQEYGIDNYTEDEL